LFGKLLGAIVGLSIGLLVQGWVAGVVFALIGLFLGHRMDELNAPPEGPVEPKAQAESLPEPQTAAELDAEARALFAVKVANLFVAVATAAGELGRDEVRVVRAFFEDGMRYSPRELDRVREALKAARDAPADLDDALDTTRAELDEPERLLLLDALYRLALADGELRPAEREVLHHAAQGLGLSDEDERAVAALHLGDAASDYARLGLEPSASDDEVRRAFKRLAAAHHPDKVAHLGPGAVALASETFRDLRCAYDAVRRVRGF
jgi:DnaJ like chaperone protein